MCSVVLLTDPSLPQSSEETGFECVLFQPSISTLPQILSIGDIVRLHRIKVDHYRGHLQAKSSKGFAALVFEGDPDIAISQHTARVSSKTFTFSIDDKEVVQKLKNWCASKNDLFQPAPSCKVADVTPNTFFDIVCQVTAVRYHQNIDCVVLGITDGTAPKHEICQCESDDFQMISSQPGVMPSVDVLVFGEHARVIQHLNVRAGGFLKLHNVHAQVYQPPVGVSLLDELNPKLELSIHRGNSYGRGLNILSVNCSLVKILTDRMRERQNLSE